jgi:hypothetical protein
MKNPSYTIDLLRFLRSALFRLSVTCNFTILLIGVLVCIFSATPLTAEPKSEMRIQISSGLAVANIPEEGDFSSHEVPFEVFLDYELGPWTEFRIGFNSSKSITTKLESRLISRSAYVAYQYTFNFFNPIYLFTYGGFAYFRSALETDSGSSISTLENSSSGYILGAGGQYSFGLIGVGSQLQYTSSETNFGNISYKIGANQLQLYIFYEF